MRCGGTVLSLLASPLCALVLRGHLDGPLRLPDLRERIGSIAQTTLRGQVDNLRAIGALERHVRSGMPYTVENELTALGRGVLEVADPVEAWLSRAPLGPIALGSEPAKGAIRALVGGWDSTLLRALAEEPRSLTELSGVISGISYPAIERRLSAMRAARLVEISHGQGSGRPCRVTGWGREAVGVLVSAGRCECRHFFDVAEPPGQIDIEAALLLAVPLVTLPEGRSGSCMLGVGGYPPDDVGAGPATAEVHVEVEDGVFSSCSPGPGARPGAWVTGSPQAWLDAVIDGRASRLRIVGTEPKLAEAIVAGLHRALALA